MYSVMFFYSKLFVFLIGILDFSSCKPEIEHRTRAASEKLSDLYCYKCDNIAHGDRCLDLKDNTTAIHMKCEKDQRICQVETITMTTNTEDSAGKPKLWLLQRNCTKVCEPVCVTIGERTKLRACTTCCETSFCNFGNGANRYSNHFITPIFSTILLYLKLFRDKFKT